MNHRRLALLAAAMALGIKAPITAFQAQVQPKRFHLETDTDRARIAAEQAKRERRNARRKGQR